MDSSIGRIPPDPTARPAPPRRVGPKQRKDANGEDFADELDEPEEPEEPEERRESKPHIRPVDRTVSPPDDDEAGHSIDVVG